jgi:hypothetical protein
MKPNTKFIFTVMFQNYIIRKAFATELRPVGTELGGKFQGKTEHLAASKKLHPSTLQIVVNSTDPNKAFSKHLNAEYDTLYPMFSSAQLCCTVSRYRIFI